MGEAIVIAVFVIAFFGCAIGAVLLTEVDWDARRRAKERAANFRPARGTWRPQALANLERGALAIYVVCEENDKPTGRVLVGYVPNEVSKGQDWQMVFEEMWQKALNRAASLNSTIER